MDNEDQFNKNAKEFYSDIRSAKEIYEKLYANVPIPKDDPEYTKKANDYLNNLGVVGIIERLDFDKIHEAMFINDGLHATKYNRYTQQKEPDLGMRLQYLRHLISIDKQERKDAENPKTNYIYVPPTWFHPEAILRGPRHHGEGSAGSVLEINVDDAVTVSENN